jgi:hypothetical protein
MDEEDRNRAGSQKLFANFVANYAVKPGKSARSPAPFELITAGERPTNTY